MRILHTTHSYAPKVGGLGEVVRQVSTRLARRGHEVHVATAAAHGGRLEEVLEGVYVHRFKVEGSAVSGIRGDVNRYMRFVRSRPWDVAAMHCAQIWTTDALLPHLDDMSGRKIFVGHGFSTLRNVKYDSYFRDLAESLRRVDKIVALSTLLEEVPFCAEHGLPEPQVIPNGVDLAEWRAATRGLRERWGIGKRFWVLLVSNHSTVKGHPAFFEVVRRVRKHFPDVAGTIIGGHYPAAKWGIGRLGVKGGCWYCCRVRARLDPGVSLRWGVPREDVVSAVQEADIMVITSWREASPLVVLESMAAGTPWVSFDVGCAKEHVGGIIVGSVREMASKVIDLLSDADLRRRLGDEGPRRVHVRHAWERIADQYEALYQHVVEEPAGVPKQCPPWRC